MQTPQFTSSLRLVKAELDLLLRQAEGQLSEYANYWESQNRDAFEQASQSLRQVAGVLEVVDLDGAQELARALSTTVNRLGECDEAGATVLLPAILRAMHLLERYLAHGLGAEQLRPELLLPTINTLRALLGQNPLPEICFFTAGSTLPAGERGFVLDPDPERIAWLGRRLRHMYQLGLLAVLRGENLEQGYLLLRRALNQLESLCGDTAFADFCRLGQAGIDGLAQGRLVLGRERQLLLGQIDRQLKRLLTRPLELDGLVPPAALVHALLYWLALAEPATPLLKELKTSAGLNGYTSEVLLTLERTVLEDAGEGVLPAARKELQAELAKLIAELDLLAGHPDMVRGAPERLIGQLSALGLTLGMLDLAEDGQRLRQAAERVRAEAEQLGREQLLAVASELMDVQARLNDLLGLPQNTTEEAQAVLSPRAQASQDSRLCLARVQEALTAYIANDWDNTQLIGVPEQLDQVCLGLHFLNAERAAVVLRTCAGFVRDRLQSAGTPPSDPQALEVLADAIICIDYYLDGLAGNQGLSQGVIELAEESAEALLRLTRAA